MNMQTQLVFVAFLSLMLLSPFMALFVKAQDDDFTLEAEQNWDTYGVGGTCVYGTHNIFVVDVDGDGVMEIVTGGFTYSTVNGSRTGSQAPLKVWSWDGQNVTLKASIKWNGSIVCLYAADLDGDNIAEIITAGSFRNEAGNNTSSLRIWNMTNGELNLIAHFEGASINSLFVSDADKDGAPEILSVGKLRNSNLNTSQLCLWAFKDSTLTLDKSVALDAANVTSANSVYASDLDNDGNQEVIIGGYSDNLANSKGQLSIWQWNGQEFILKANQTWQLAGGTAKTIAGGTQGNTAVNNVKAGDLDGDGYKEIVTGGFAYDGEKVNAQVKICRWDGNTLTEKASQEWATDYLTEVKCLSLNDVDDDGKMDIVESGIVAAQGSFKNSEGIHDRGQLRVYSWDGTTLTLKQSKDWTFNDGACAWNVANGDVDKDGVVEMITVGCTALNDLCDPDMRIWSLPSVSTTSNYLPYVLAAVLIATAAFSVLVFFTRKKKATPVY
jgi:hypothetical protein